MSVVSSSGPSGSHSKKANGRHYGTTLASDWMSHHWPIGGRFRITPTVARVRRKQRRGGGASAGLLQSSTIGRIPATNRCACGRPPKLGKPGKVQPHVKQDAPATQAEAMAGHSVPQSEFRIGSSGRPNRPFALACKQYDDDESETFLRVDGGRVPGRRSQGHTSCWPPSQQKWVTQKKETR